MDRTFVMIKPDGVHRRLVGEVVSRFERKGLRLVGMRLIRMSQDQARRLYKVHEGKPFYNGLINFITSGPALVMVIEGYKAVEVVRRMLGKTAAFEAEPGTIRGDLGLSRGKNIVHGSDSVENARYEMSIFFTESDLVNYTTPDIDWVYEPDERT